MTTTTEQGMSRRRQPAAALASCDVPVTDVQVSAYTVPTGDPAVVEGDGTLTWDSTTMVLVRAVAGGHSGIGWTYGPTACVDVVREKLAPEVLGHSALDVEAVNLAMSRALRNDGRPGAGAMALSAVDVALWDLEARLLDLPLHRLLGRCREAVPVYGSGGFTTYTDRQTVEQLTRWRAAGIHQVKIKVGEGRGAHTRRDTSRARLARSTIGPRADLFVDANGAYTPQQAITWLRAAEAGISWFEEPVTSDDLDGLSRVRDGVDADVTAGEYGYDLSYFARMVGAGAVDCLQVDASRCGGITEWRRAAALAAANHLEVSGHCAPHLHAAVAAATPNLRHLEWFHDHVRIESHFFDGATDCPEGGLLPVSDGPGHGLELKASAAEPFRVR
jgi:L-alanine-DL-glutamate epimerase-like enolase superfamily enzyme